MRCSRLLPITATLCLLLLAGQTATAVAVPPEVAIAAAQAAPGTSGALAVAKDVFAVPKAAAEILLLPMGVLESVFCPLPGIEFMSGMRHIGSGILAPFKLVTSVLCLPYNVVTDLGGK